MSLKISDFLSLFCVMPGVTVAFFSIQFCEAGEKPCVESAHSQVTQIEEYLSEQQGELLSVDTKEKDILGQLERLEKDVTGNREEVRELSDKIENVSEEIVAGQGRIGQLNQSSLAVRKTLKRRLVAFYKFGRPGYVRLLANSTSLQEFQKAIKYTKALMNQDKKILDMLARQMSQIENEVQILKENVAALEALKRAKNESKALLEKSIEKKVLLLMKVHREKEFYAKAVEELRGATQALNHAVMYLEKGDKQEFLPRGFAEMKGKIPLPLHGRILRGTQLVKSNPFMHRKGVYITGCSREEVRSVFPGRVDFCGWFKGYGQLMIINHGSHYFTIFAHLDEILKQKGEMVSGGEAVGLVGNPGWDAGPGVYFEIRKGREHLDPRTWLKIE
jgi:septal ring factor EnvC (AmiA/AmiB activator)